LFRFSPPAVVRIFIEHFFSAAPFDNLSFVHHTSHRLSINYFSSFIDGEIIGNMGIIYQKTENSMTHDEAVVPSSYSLKLI
jgi:hypothetical protein